MSQQVRHISVYDGTAFLGTVAGFAKEWHAFDASGKQLFGVFKSMKAAVAAFNASLPCSCVRDPSERGGGGGT